jgi:hypothetical protein
MALGLAEFAAAAPGAPMVRAPGPRATQGENGAGAAPACAFAVYDARIGTGNASPHSRCHRLPT